MPVMLKPTLALRDPLDEVWTVTDADGRFLLPVQPAHSVDDSRAADLRLGRHLADGLSAGQGSRGR